MDSAGIVSDHPADGATIVAGGIGREGEVMLFGGVAELIEYNAGLHTSDAACRIDRKNSPHVLGKIQHDGDIAALTCKRCAAPAAE
jgi:hypothetical protein